MNDENAKAASAAQPEQPAPAAVGGAESIEAAIAKTLAEFEAKGRDVRADDATRRGWTFACMILRNLAAPSPDVAALQAKIAHLQEALEPVVKVVDALAGVYGFGDDSPINTTHFTPEWNDFPPLNWGDLRRVVAALSRLKQEDQG